jgi:hypothetical protein
MVRVRILKPMVGVMDGQRLGRFTPGLTYDVDDALGHHLVALGGAQHETDPRHAIHISEDGLDDAQLTDGVTVVPPDDRANDRKPRGKKLKS